MNQPRSHSVIESVANVIVGYWVAFFANLFLLPVVGVHISVSANIKFSIMMTAISLIRSYTLRRAFERFRPKLVEPYKSGEDIDRWWTFKEVCMGCGKDWDGSQCGHQLNAHLFSVCRPMQVRKWL